MMSEICIGGRFLEDCFCLYSQQIISAVFNEFLIPYIELQKHTEAAFRRCS